MPSAWLAFLSECFLCCVLTLWGWSRESWELSVGWLYLEFKGERHHPLAAGPGEQEVGCRPHPLTSLDRVGLEVMQFATQQREDWRACPACLGLAGTTQKSYGSERSTSHCIGCTEPLKSSTETSPGSYSRWMLLGRIINT